MACLGKIIRKEGSRARAEQRASLLYFADEYELFGVRQFKLINKWPGYGRRLLNELNEIFLLTGTIFHPLIQCNYSDEPVQMDEIWPMLCYNHSLEDVSHLQRTRSKLYSNQVQNSGRQNRWIKTSYQYNTAYSV